MAQKRFVSLHGFFAFTHSSVWQNETDEAGHYIFSKAAGGQGVLRVMLLQNEFTGIEAAKKMLDEVYKQNQTFNAELLVTPNATFVSFVKEHLVQGTSYTVYYWATANNTNVVLFTFTVQTHMKELTACQNEKHEMETMVASFEFLKEKEHKH